MIRIGCIIPGGSFMPQGEKSVSRAFTVIREGSIFLIDSGFDFVEISCGMLMELTEEELDSLVGRVRIEATNCFIPNRYQLLGDRTGVEDYLDACMRRMKMLGADTVVFGSGGARMLPAGMPKEEGYKRIVSFLQLCEPFCEKYGVTVVIEPLNAPEAKCEFMNLVSECYGIQQAADRPHIKLLADVYHMAVMKEPIGVFHDVKDALHHVHVSEPDRKCPGTGTTDYIPNVIKTLKEIGYDRRITAECGFNDFFKDAPKAAEYLRRLVEEQ